MRSVRAFLPIPGDPDGLWHVLQDEPSRWLPDAEPRQDGSWSMRVHGSGFSRLVLAQVGTPWRSGRTLWRSLSWDPAEDPAAVLARLLPSCDGEMGLHRLEASATLLFDGRYQPPGGHLGAAMDTLALSRIAQSTIDRLVNDVAERLANAVAEAVGRPRSPIGDPRHQ